MTEIKNDQQVAQPPAHAQEQARSFGGGTFGAMAAAIAYAAMAVTPVASRTDAESAPAQTTPNHTAVDNSPRAVSTALGNRAAQALRQIDSMLDKSKISDLGVVKVTLEGNVSYLYLRNGPEHSHKIKLDEKVVTTLEHAVKAAADLDSTLVYGKNQNETREARLDRLQTAEISAALRDMKVNSPIVKNEPAQAGDRLGAQPNPISDFEGRVNNLRNRIDQLLENDKPSNQRNLHGRLKIEGGDLDQSGAVPEYRLTFTYQGKTFTAAVDERDLSRMETIVAGKENLDERQRVRVGQDFIRIIGEHTSDRTQQNVRATSPSQSQQNTRSTRAGEPIGNVRQVVGVSRGPYNNVAPVDGVQVEGQGVDALRADKAKQAANDAAVAAKQAQIDAKNAR